MLLLEQRKVQLFDCFACRRIIPSVRVNAISPSLCETPLGSKVIHNDKIKEALSATYPLNGGTADDIASLCKFLISDNASWITGQISGVDGGRGSIASI